MQMLNKPTETLARCYDYINGAEGKVSGQPADMFHVYAMFPQLWNSTALGFGGVGGAAMTEAYTTVLQGQRTGEALVFFDGRFAYRIKNPNPQFFDDVRNRVTAPVEHAEELYERPPINRASSRPK